MMKYVSSLADIPNEPHYVIVAIQSVHIPGDERSRTNPGHGYPEHTEHYVQMQVTTDKAVWSVAVTKLLEHDPKQQEFKAYHVDSMAKISHHIEVKI